MDTDQQAARDAGVDMANNGTVWVAGWRVNGGPVVESAAKRQPNDGKDAAVFVARTCAAEVRKALEGFGVVGATVTPVVFERTTAVQVTDSAVEDVTEAGEE